MTDEFAKFLQNFRLENRELTGVTLITLVEGDNGVESD